ncbi:DNA polymerase III subunit beta family protein [Streptomyces europaeiscabiei]|uniref:DNA polymerase III subunit beta family protein n=1 Tax=Streptomyces europaeiscabiei TaxID=146819 RepID=UPI0029B0933D|nr:MerR family transcriptional regulator [Streptomyces europaeiscabiei]MDX3776675.1 MerR family transcriptional regulator [Streptomyces europaeiscabiei]MDX3842547.1 MerR family transcriptional regulator [Streptomyces europaeiscabiei]
MPIGVFARRSGLTSSALRFYADSGLLRPAEVDPASGYRYYTADQMGRATALRRLREIAMPLTAVEKVLDAGPEEAAGLIDEHVARVLGDAVAAQRTAVLLKSALGDVPSLPVVTLKGPMLADAVEQILTATAREPDLPVLGGLRIEADQEAVTLTATDRYRLSTRTLVPSEPPATTWAGTVSGDELRGAVAEVRRSALVRVEATAHGIRLRMPDREDQYCRLLPEEFPDLRLMLAGLPEVSTRVTLSKQLLLRALEERCAERVALRVAEHGTDVLVGGDEQPESRLPATVTGRGLDIRFELTTLYPAVSTAIGPDVMLDLRGPDQPVTIRSADRGDLTTLAMPVSSHLPPQR